jgi:undecaprenyl-diphosphatase
LTVLQALVLGVVEGITEFLPVSSTGHLLLAQHLMDLHGDAAVSYAIVIQAGAILAVLGAYRERWAGVVRGTAEGRQLLLRLGVAFAPAGVIGLLLDDAVEALLTGLWPVVVAWAVGGVVLLVWEGPDGGRGIDDLSLRQAGLIGLAQCVALWPGTSRSLAAIVGGWLVGLDRRSAVEFSFLLGVVTLGAATCWSALKHADALWTYGPVPLATGLLAAWVSAWASISFLLAWVSGRGLRVFGVWRLALAGAVATGWALG